MKELEIITKKPEGRRKGVVVFLHGACHGAWCWERFLDYFPQHGYEACAFSLPGHGKSWGCDPAEKLTFDDFLEATQTVMRHYDGEAVLVGHSLGGTITQKFLFDHPELAKGGVLVATGMAVWLQKGLRGKCEMFRVMMAPEFKSVMRAMGNRVPQNGEELSQSGFFSGRVTAAEAEKWCGQMVTEKVSVPFSLSIDGSQMKVPIRTVATDRDVCSTLQQQEKIAASYGVEPVILHGLCHDMMLDPEWEQAAAYVLKLVEEMTAR